MSLFVVLENLAGLYAQGRRYDMTPEIADAWLSTVKGLYRYTNCTIDHSDAASVRDANVEAEEYAKVAAPHLTAIAQERSDVRSG